MSLNDVERKASQSQAELSLLSRRSFLQSTAAGLAGLSLSAGAPRASWAADDDGRLPVAGVVSVYHKNSHADVLLGKVLAGWRQDGGPGPGLRLVSLYVDQTPESDLSRGLAEKHGFRLAKTIDEAVTFGTNELKVAGVFSIAEHGKYPDTPDTLQTMYPRRKFFDEIVAAYRRVGKTAPVFNDKHLSYRFDDARHMVDTAAKANFPLLAGSSLPVAWREPRLDLPENVEIEGAVTLAYGGLEAYGFHALEGHQWLVERRRGGEAGVVSVQALRGDEIGRALDDGRLSRELFDLAWKADPAVRKKEGDAKPKLDWTKGDHSAVYLLEHRDGLRSAVAVANGLAREMTTAVRIKGRAEPLSTWFKLEEDAPYGHFAYLVHAFERTIRAAKTPYPIERTLLTTGILDRALHSFAQGGIRLETPELAIRYVPTNWPYANHPDCALKLPYPK